MLIHKWLHFLKPFKEFHHHTWYIQKQYLIVIAVMSGVFLPVRLVYYTYVTHHVGLNLGLMSAIAVGMYVLVHYNKLGIFGIYFKNRIRRIVFRKLFYVAVFGIFYSMSIYGLILWEVHKGEFDYKAEREYLFANSLYGVTTGNATTVYPPLDFSSENSFNPETVDDVMKNLNPRTIQIPVYTLDYYHGFLQRYNLLPSDKAMIQIGSLNQTERQLFFIGILGKKDDFISMIKTIDIILSITAYELNIQSGAWGSHFSSVVVINDIEALCLLFFYRKVYLKKAGDSWNGIGMYGKNIKRFWIKDAQQTEIKRFKHWCKGFC